MLQEAVESAVDCYYRYTTKLYDNWSR